MGSPWFEVDDTTSVAFFLCVGQDFAVIRRQRDVCEVKDRDHGHIMISCEDGVGRVPFCCRSRAGVAAVMAKIPWFTPQERMAVANLPEVLALPEELTPEEQEILQNPKLFHRWTSFNFVSA